jgi:hypothetical protein
MAPNSNCKCPIIQFNQQAKRRVRIGKEWAGSEGKNDIVYRKAARDCFRKCNMEPIIWKTWDQILEFSEFWIPLPKRSSHVNSIIKDIYLHFLYLKSAWSWIMRARIITFVSRTVLIFLNMSFKASFMPLRVLFVYVCVKPLVFYIPTCHSETLLKKTYRFWDSEHGSHTMVSTELGRAQLNFNSSDSETPNTVYQQVY